MRVLASERDDAQRALGGVVVDLDGAVVEIACKRDPTRERVANRSGHLALGREGLKHLIKPCAKLFHHRPGTSLSDWVSDLWRASAHLFFDGVEQADAPDGLGSSSRCGGGEDVVELAPRMRPACCFDDSSSFIEWLKSRIGVGLEGSTEALQVGLRVFAAAVG